MGTTASNYTTKTRPARKSCVTCATAASPTTRAIIGISIASTATLSRTPASALITPVPGQRRPGRSMAEELHPHLPRLGATGITPRGLKRQPVTVTNTSANLLNAYQVKLNVGYDTAMKGDFSDLRFTDSNGTTLIPFWIENYVASSRATLWIKTTVPPNGAKFDRPPQLPSNPGTALRRCPLRWFPGEAAPGPGRPAR